MKEIKITLFSDDKITNNGNGALIEIEGREPIAVTHSNDKRPVNILYRILEVLQKIIKEDGRDYWFQPLE